MSLLSLRTALATIAENQSTPIPGPYPTYPNVGQGSVDPGFTNPDVYSQFAMAQAVCDQGGNITYPAQTAYGINIPAGPNVPIRGLGWTLWPDGALEQYNPGIALAVLAGEADYTLTGFGLSPFYSIEYCNVMPSWATVSWAGYYGVNGVGCSVTAVSLHIKNAGAAQTLTFGVYVRGRWRA
jgi:hypothetical protein